MSQIVSLFQAAVYFGTVILFGAVGEILAEKSGNLNLGVPGIMYMGGIAGLIAAFLYENGTANPVPAVAILVTLAAAFVMSMIGGLIYSVLTITLRANQNVTGLTLTIFGSGFANLLAAILTKWPAVRARSPLPSPAAFTAPRFHFCPTARVFSAKCSSSTASLPTLP